MKTVNEKLILDPIVPIELHSEFRDQILDDIKKMNSANGIRRIFICGPGLGTRINGFPSEEQTEKLIDDINYASEVLNPHGIEVGWWCAPFLTMGRNPYFEGHPDFKDYNFQHITGIKGEESPVAACPYDKKYQEKLGNFIKEVAAATDPFLILVEDDFRLSYHSPADWGCFCPLHLKRFNELAGTDYSREELYKIFSSDDTQLLPLRRVFADVCRESMVEMASAVRKKLDELKPDLRIGICQSGTCDLDGNNFEAVARAIAGKNKPFIRCWGSQYGSDDAASIPEVIFHFMYSADKLPDDFEIVHETDTYPHNRFFTSAAKIRSLLTLAVCSGAKGSLLYLSQYLDNPLEDKGYMNIITNYGKQLDTLLAESRKNKALGVQLMYSAEQEWTRPYKGTCPSYAKSLWAGVLGRFGIPYSCSEQKVKFAGKDFIKTLNDQEIKKLLSGRVFLDGGAAALLSKRGFATMIGAQVEPSREILCLYEQIALDNPFNKDIAGSLMYNFAIAPAGKEGGGFFNLDTFDKSISVSSFIAPDGKKLGAAATLFENELDGKVAIMAYELENNHSSSIFNYRKKEVLRRMIEWLENEALPVYVEQEPNILCQAFEQNKTGDLLVVLINLSSDPLSEVKFRLAGKVAHINVLMPDGSWQESNYNTIENEKLLIWKPESRLGISEPVILKFKHS